MPSKWRTVLGLAAAAAAVVGSLATATGASAAPPPNLVGFANLAQTQMLTLDQGRFAITADADQNLEQVWDMVYQTQFPTQPGFSSPYFLQARGKNVCLQDVGAGNPILAVACQDDPVEGSGQLWQHHRVPDRVINGREYTFLFHRSTALVLTAAPSSPDAERSRVISAPAEPVSRSGAADHQLWVMLAA